MSISATAFLCHWELDHKFRRIIPMIYIYLLVITLFFSISFIPIGKTSRGINTWSFIVLESYRIHPLGMRPFYFIELGCYFVRQLNVVLRISLLSASSDDSPVVCFFSSLDNFSVCVPRDYLAF